jgi:GxGYxY sequence motif in domain of unknown function N-terminal/GxGYxYP putative glycoside hydrolase C-terminal domain
VGTQLRNQLLFKLILFFGIILEAGPSFAASGMFPKMPEATNVYVANIHKDSGDAWMTAWALQGLINQKSAEVYLINNPWDRDPLKECGKPYEELPRLSGTDAGLRTLFQKYQQQVKKMFVYNPEKDWTWYLALMSSAQQGGIPVTESIKNELISEFNWNGNVEDFQNRWTNRIHAYNWALENLMPDCTKKVVFATSNRRDRYEERIGNPITDYAVASKGFVFWLDFDKPDELAEVEKIFRTPGYGVGTSLMGYASDGDAANEVANRHGIGYVVSELYANGSFWSSFPDKTYNQSPGKAAHVEPGKIYASIMWSDGDNLEYDQNPLYKYWHDPARGKIPVATPLAPALQELNSPLLDWYYSEMTTNDELVAGPTGFQFIHIRDFKNDLFTEWCKLNHPWCTDAGFRSVYMWLMPSPTPKYVLYTKTCGLNGALGEFFSTDTNLPSIPVSGITDESRLYPEFTAVRPKAHAPVFHNFVCVAGGFYHNGDHGYSAIKEQIDHLETDYPGRYVFLLPKDQFATIRAYYSSEQLPQEIIGRPGGRDDLIPVSNGDGNFSIIQRNGLSYWSIPKHSSPNYFYLRIADDFLPKPGASVEIDLGYLDSGSGDIVLDYDSTDSPLPDKGAFKRYPHAVQRMNSGQWKLAQFYVSDANFQNRENGGADFRFYNGGDDLLVSYVKVRRLKP